MKNYQNVVASSGISEYLKENAGRELNSLYRKIKQNITDINIITSKDELVFQVSNLSCQALDYQEYEKLREKLTNEGFTGREVMELVTASTLGYIIDEQYKERNINRKGILKYLFSEKEVNFLESAI